MQKKNLKQVSIKKKHIRKDFANNCSAIYTADKTGLPYFRKNNREYDGEFSKLGFLSKKLIELLKSAKVLVEFHPDLDLRLSSIWI